MLNSHDSAAGDLTPAARPDAVVLDRAGVRVKNDERGARPGHSIEVAIIDWDLLFRAVIAKLRQTGGTTALFEPLPHDAPGAVQAQVLQCAAALDQLHATMLHQVERGRALEAALRDAQSALTQVRGEWARAEAGERNARHLAEHDGLTSLPNGSSFRVRLATVLSEAAMKGQTFAVLYIDLDGFKAINDVHGHATGDELLRIIAARLAGAVRAQDMVSRVGGDEFAC